MRLTYRFNLSLYAFPFFGIYNPGHQEQKCLEPQESLWIIWDKEFGAKM
jgi:hypothetical protein